MSLLDHLGLPAPVLERLAADDGRVLARGHDGALKPIEARLQKAELRKADDGSPILDGYATVYDHAYEVAGGPPYGWMETIVRGACDKSLREKDDVRLLINHDGLPLARTSNKSLTLTTDDTGLRCEAKLDMRRSYIADLVYAMEDRTLDEMSFAFRALRQEWNDDYTERFITEVKLYDVSVVTYPANPATVVQLRTEQPVGMSLALAAAIADTLRTA